MSKIAGGPNLKFAVEKDGDGWVWNAMVKEFSVKITMHKGQGHSVGAHAPNFKVTKHNLIDLNPSLLCENEKHWTERRAWVPDDLPPFPPPLGPTYD